MKFKITSDAFYISKRVKDIDKSYYILLNTSSGKFELHSSEQNNSYCLTLPFSSLDERTLNYIRATRVENMEEFLAKLDLKNQLNESANKTRVLTQLDELISDNFKEQI